MTAFTKQMELALPIDVDPAPSRRDYDRMVAYNGELLRRHNDMHEQMLETGAALEAWAASFPDGMTPEDRRDAALLDYFNENWSRP